MKDADHRPSRRPTTAMPRAQSRKPPAEATRTASVFACLDGTASADARRALEARARTDADLAREFDAAQALFAALDGLGRHSPAPGFAVRVRAAASVPTSWRARLLAILGRPDPSARANPFAAALDGRLSPRQERSLAAFAAEDPEVRRAWAEWAELDRRTKAVGRFRPATGFADRVLSQVPLRAPAPERGFGAWARRWRGRRRERWALACGAAFGPVAGVASLGYALVGALWLGGDPARNASSAAAYLWTTAADAAATAAAGLWDAATTSPAAGGVVEMAQRALGSAPALALASSVFAGLAALSAWILYRQLFGHSVPERAHAPV